MQIKKRLREITASCLFFVLWVILSCCFVAKSYAGIVTGRVTDSETGETLIGATVSYAEGAGALTDVDGHYSIEVPEGKQTLTVRYVGYRPEVRELTIGRDPLVLDVSLTPDNAVLQDVVVLGEKRQETEQAVVREQQQSLVTMTGVSEQFIKRTQDKDASEVIRRIPGVSIIDEKFVLVRGLSQRYNNVWLNGAAVASSEADQRAFSFDIIPSSQLDNLKVVKSAAPDYPADFTGGFILLQTKDVPLRNTWSVRVGGNYHTSSHGKDFLHYVGSGTDFLGFDSGKRGLSDGIHSVLKPQGNGYSLTDNGLNNDWRISTLKPIADLNLSADVAHRWQTASGQTIGLNGSLNYSNAYRTILQCENNLFGAYDVTHQRSNYLRRMTDDQYSNNVRLGGMLGLVWLSADNSQSIKLKQIVNLMGKNRYTYRSGYDAQSDYNEQAEYYFQSRLTYNLGLSGKHVLGSHVLEWNAGYVFANRNLPDRRRYTVYGQEDGSLEVENLNDLNREFSLLKEHIYSVGVNWKHDLTWKGWKPFVKAGVYGERRRRRYDTRFFTYAWPNGQLPQSLRNQDVTTELLTDANYGPEGLYLLEQVDWSNNYEATGLLGCGYLSLHLPFFDGRLEAYGGVRFESSHTELISHTRRQEYSPLSTQYDYNDFFPSLNLVGHLTPTQQLRLAYGRTTNRPEFRELSTSVYYDFELASNVQGNHNLLPAYVDNLDLGWEWYPHAGEVVSLSLFYKHFRNPIEWTYTVAGGTDLVYSYLNAKGANNYGVELEVRKQLDFLKLPQWSLSVNASYIHSKVTFPADSREQDRPMQGQSPYLVNIGLFYHSDEHPEARGWKQGWTASVLYNTIGKRIVGVGRSVGSGETDVRVPDSYEMPRHQVDLNLNKSFGRVSLGVSLRDILGQRVQFKQFEQTAAGEVEQVMRSYKPGRSFSLSVAYKL